MIISNLYDSKCSSRTFLNLQKQFYEKLVTMEKAATTEGKEIFLT